MCACMWGQRSASGDLPLALELTDWLFGQLFPSDPPCLPIPSTEVTNMTYHTWFFHMGFFGGVSNSGPRAISQAPSPAFSIFQLQQLASTPSRLF